MKTLAALALMTSLMAASLLTGCSVETTSGRPVVLDQQNDNAPCAPSRVKKGTC